MCGRATLTTPPEDIQEAFGLAELPDLPPRYNIAPTQPIAVVREPHHLDLVRWGLLSSGAAPFPGGGINVRAETVARAPAYRDAFRTRRCLVVVDGFFEWTGEGKARTPYLVRKADSKPFALGGIWSRRVSGDGEVTDSCAILTRAALGVVARLHDRMPVVIPPSAYDAWLGPEDGNAWLAAPPPAWVAVPVSTLINRAANDVAACLEPAPGAPVLREPKADEGG
jgi:putative SOS response-associated peptidase YedK